MQSRIVLFVSLALLIFFGLHSLLYFLLLKVFSLKGKWGRIGLAGLLSCLALCFITAFIWSRSGDHTFLRWFYYSSVLWLGVLVNLLLILGAGLFLFTLLDWLGIKPDRRTFGIYLLGLTTIYTAYGLYHATQIHINTLSVKIRNIPEKWQGRKIAQISDVHLGLINGAGLAERISDRINQQNVDLVFITGDLFDGTGDHLLETVSPLDRIRAPIYYIIGNHETYLGLDRVVRAIAQTRIQLLRDKIVELDGVQIIGADYPSRGEKKDIGKLLEKADPKKPGLLLFHEPAQVETVRRYNVFLQLSGHTHNGQMWPMKIFTHLIYKGLDYGLHQMGDYALYTSSGVGTWGPPMRIGSTPEIVVITFG
jgi:predicted MPP superfamily phosphohydrolase